jgi:hypothetical protein
LPAEPAADDEQSHSNSQLCCSLPSTGEQMATPSSSFRRSAAQDELRDITQSLQSLPLSVVLYDFCVCKSSINAPVLLQS